MLIVERASHKLVTCNNTLTKKRAHKEEQLLIAQMNGLKLSRQLSSHSSERWIVGAPVDGYDPTTKTVFQYHGCHWHGCCHCFPHKDEIINPNQTRENKFLATIKCTRLLWTGGNYVIEKWVCDDQNTQDSLLKQETRSYPRVIVCDFELYQDKTKKNEVTASLTYENAHVPISVSIGYMLEHMPMHRKGYALSKSGMRCTHAY